MRIKEFTYEYNEVSYPVKVTYKRMRNTTYRFRNGEFLVSAPIIVGQKEIIRGLDKFAAKLINYEIKKPVPFGENYIYILGNRYELNDSHILEAEGQFVINYKDHDDLEKKLKKWFKPYITNRVRNYEKLMGLLPYNVRIQKMSSRYGSNSKHTKSLNFATLLLHYDTAIIDSVIVHELAHEVVYNHSPSFYKVVYQYCPNYDLWHTKLRKGEYQ